LKINYRTSHQIRMRADRLLGPEVSDVDGNVEERKGTVSLFNGPPPKIEVLESQEKERQAVAKWIKYLIASGVAPSEMGIFVRSEEEIPRASAAANLAGLPFTVIDAKMEAPAGRASISTMHLAKGLEFRAVVVMACDDEIIPSQARIETVTDDSDLEEVYATERHLLYVACTRARDHLLVTGVEPASEFLDDLRK
jgi:superfamily I DNA/RNA helicase